MNIPIPSKSGVVRINLIKVIVLIIAVVFLLSAASITITSQSGFCNSCHIMDLAYSSWEHSEHHDVSCLSCHIQPGFTSYMKGKINGLSQAFDCMVGRVGTNPSATVLDISCLRSSCHTTEELMDDEIDFGGIKYTHTGHINETIDGIKMSCATCHGHFEGEDHFSVDKQTCFTCHFIKDENSEDKVVKTECLDCHDVPDKMIERGLVKINHQEFTSYVANCEDSCHSRQTRIASNVSDKSCLNCHAFSMDPEYTSEELHHEHSIGEKVECFACHGTVEHSTSESSSVAAMINCKNCHSDTHNAQKSIFTASSHPTGKDDDRILSPMFLTHVECTDCHIEQSGISTGVLDSVGTVAKASAEACDRCHEAGTGDKYVPFWQNQIKKLHGQVTDKMNELEASLKGGDADENSRKSIALARQILDSVAADGSWGVHNLKYTEAMLLQANDKLTQASRGQYVEE